MKKNIGFKKLSWKLTFIIAMTVVIVGGAIAGYMQSRIISEIGVHTDMGFHNQILDNSEGIEAIFTDAVYMVGGMRRLAETSFNPDLYAQDAVNYFDGTIRAAMDSYIHDLIEDSAYIVGAYFAVDPDLAGFPLVAEVYFEEGDYGIEAVEPQSYEEYMQVDSEDMAWFYGAFNSGAPYWAPIYEWIDGTIMVSYGEPVIVGGRTVGIAGVDIYISEIEDLIRNVTLYDTGFALLKDNYRNFFYTNEVIQGFSANEKASLIDAATAADGEVFDITLGGINYKAAAGDFSNGYMIYILAPTREVNAEITASLTRFVIIFAVCFILVIVISYFVARPISRPLTALSTLVRGISTTGNLTLRQEDIDAIDTYSKLKDETGQIVEDIAAFIEYVQSISDVLGYISEGDLTHDVKPISDSDTMGLALHHLFDNLNNMFGEINVVTNQVSSGSKQIADGAQIMAHGSTQQAATVEELSSAVSEIAQKTKTNAEMASNAAILAMTIKDSAEKGSQQMNEMTAAVKDINEAGHSIGKVIKVIDDIAFQTNILALNAAVEAARAGQHGKGFAVVAEEVRTLASKSAEAAKDTSGLITNSMKKAELGAKIADETAASLVEIVSGINESSQIVLDIAQSSDEQSAGISQINSGIDQVAQVVQQNSATAEQSAAASEEMSSQSSILEQLVAQFRLKEGRSLPNPDRQSLLPPDRNNS